MGITQQHLDLLRSISRNAIATDQDIALSVNVVIALLDEILRLQKDIAELTSDYIELQELCEE